MVRSRRLRPRRGAGLLSLVCAALAVSAGAASSQVKHFPERKQLCTGCHGANGVSPTDATPSLGGMPELYSLLQLVAFRDGQRKAEAMNAMLADMTDDDLRAAAEYVASQPRPTPPSGAVDAARMQRGGGLVGQHRCGQCHGAEFLGGEQMPPLRNQREDYLLKALRDFKAERRLGDRAAMVEIVTPLTDADLADVAYFLAHVRE